jgi:DnaJ-class molecular chaperone
MTQVFRQNDEIECLDCEGCGTRQNLNDPSDVRDCEQCNGTGWRVQTIANNVN